MTRNELAAEVIRILQDNCDTSQPPISEHTSISALQLEIDEAAEEIEEAFDVNFCGDDFYSFGTVADIVAYFMD